MVVFPLHPLSVADKVTVTFHDVQLQLADDILAVVDKDNYEVELDRRKAIVKALDMIKDDDVVLLLGKGHEDYQILGHEKVHFDDAEEVRNYLKSHK